MTDLVDSTFRLTADTASKVDRLERELGKLPQTLVPPLHHVHGGIYARTGMIPAGTTFMGAVHKKDHINIVCGDVTVMTEEGAQRFTGYHVLPACVGSKRVAYAHSDTMWTTTARTDLTDVQEIENELVEDCGSLQTRKILEA